MSGHRVPFALLLLLLLLAGSALSLSVSASAFGGSFRDLRHRLGMKPMAPETCSVPLKTEAPPCSNGCTQSQGPYKKTACIELYFDVDVCRYEWGKYITVDGVTKKETCVDSVVAERIFNTPNGFCLPNPNLKSLAEQLLTAEINIDPAIGNAFASHAIVEVMAAARPLISLDNCGTISAPLQATIEGLKNQLEAFNKGQAAGSAGYCNKVIVNFPTETLEAESGYSFESSTPTSSLDSSKDKWSATGLPASFVINSATGKITSSLVEVVSVITTYHFTLFVKLESGTEWHGGAVCRSITIYPKYVVTCPAANVGETVPSFTIGEAAQTFKVEATGGAGPDPSSKISLQVTNDPSDASPPLLLPEGIAFTAEAGTGAGTLSGIEEGKSPAAGEYTFTLSSTDKRGREATAKCTFIVYAKYELACPVGDGTPIPTFAIGGDAQSFQVKAAGGADPIVTALDLTITGVPVGAANPSAMPPNIVFTQDPDNLRAGTLGGTAAATAVDGVYTYQLTLTDARSEHVLEGCRFQVLRSQNQDVFEGCTYTIGFYKNHRDSIFSDGVKSITLGQLTFTKEGVTPYYPVGDMVKILSFTYSLNKVPCLAKDPLGKAMAQALAARISIAHGASSSPDVDKALAFVDTAMKTDGFGCGSKKMAADLAWAQTILDTFNNGCLAGNPLHCVDNKYTAPKPPYVRPATCPVV